jgi:glycosyltransferase involved in cell wall biosynthesis
MNLKRKRIFIHDSVVTPAGQRGVNRCYNAYAQALIETFPGQISIYSMRATNLKGAKIIHPPSMWVRPRAISNQIARFDIKYGATLADLLANVYYSPYYGYMRTKIPQVFSAYDMIYEKFPQYFRHSEAGISEHIQEKKACFERAALIICISRNTANDILEIYPNISKDRVKVVYLGMDDLFFRSSDATYNNKPYFLYVGNRDRYKNFLRFIDAFGKSGLKKSFDLRIISPVQNDFNVDEKEIISRHGLADNIVVEFSIPDSELKKRYAGARAFVYPTEYEGFGLPVIEALASGTLVLASNTSCLREVGGTAPLYFDPYSTDTIVDMLKIASQMNDSERQERILAGKSWAVQYNWKNSKRGFVHVIQELLNGL